MKQYTNTSDEKLYQQIMDELDADAREYDRMMETGECPAQRTRVVKMYLRMGYVAACAVAVILLAVYPFMNGNSTGDKALAEHEGGKVKIERREKGMPSVAASEVPSYQEKMPVISQIARTEKRNSTHGNAAGDYVAELPSIDIMPSGNMDLASIVVIVEDDNDLSNATYYNALPIYNTDDSTLSGALAVGISDIEINN